MNNALNLLQYQHQKYRNILALVSQKCYLHRMICAVHKT